MTACTFSDFYAACASRLTEQQLRDLNPHAQYFKLKDGYCGLLIEPDRTWVSVLVGGIEDIWALRRVLMKARVSLAGFKCRLGSPTYALAKYYGAEISESGDFYSDGAPCIRCIVKRGQRRLLIKDEEKSQALI